MDAGVVKPQEEEDEDDEFTPQMLVIRLQAANEVTRRRHTCQTVLLCFLNLRKESSLASEGLVLPRKHH